METLLIYSLFTVDNVKDLQITNCLGLQNASFCLAFRVLSDLSPTPFPQPPLALYTDGAEQMAQKVHALDSQWRRGDSVSSVLTS